MQDELVNLLRGVEFFHDLAEENLRRVAAISKIVEFPGRHDIFRENEPASDVYIIISGRVSLVICAPPVGCRQLMEVGAGELIGWSPLVGRSRLSDTARTLTPTKAIAMDGQRILSLCTEDPRFGFEFMHRAAQTLASRLHAARMQLLKMSGRLLPEAQIETD
jgi:CRP/FNR family transcriptional regulator, cyclic AMP receptor protein